ncbi:GIP, partial [Symbiodinium necroappetens]
SSAKPATLPNIMEFNQLVAVDAFYVYDVDGEKVELMMIVDIGTGYISVGHLQGHSGVAMEASFCSIWSNVFGAPGTMVLDLESGLQAGLGRFSEWHGTKIRAIAEQAHWQNGTAERDIRTWKEIWSRLVDEWSATAEEAGMITTAANTAMNTLRRESGFSPSQAVWGRDPRLPEDLKGNPAKEAYFKTQNDARLRRSLLQRSRVAGPDLQQGDHVFFYRKPKNNKNWEWHGPGVIIGHEGPNVWVSFAGRCHLVAPEHLRTASAEELGAAFSLRATQDDLQRLLEQDFGDEEMYEAEDHDMDEDLALTPEGEDRDGGRGDGTRRGRDGTPPPAVTKRIRTKGPQAREAHTALHEAYMMKFPKTPRGKEKALEKELPWGMIPPEQHQGFKDAELRQWEEHVEHNALEALSIEESRQVLKDKPQRALNSRFAYRDKLWSRRREQPDVGWKHKARLVISGHKDPDLLSGLPTHAPTISRQGILLLLQILASNLVNDWCGYAGDVTAAFLCGEVLQRELYLRQPRTGLGDLHPEVTQCSLDHCIFMVQRFDGDGDLGPPQTYLGVHVDDVLLVGLRSLCEVIKAKISERFPIRDWETGKFNYVGSFIEIKEDSVKISQASYAATRLFQVEIDKDIPDHAEVTETIRDPEV